MHGPSKMKMQKSILPGSLHSAMHYSHQIPSRLELPCMLARAIIAAIQLVISPLSRP